MREIVLALRAIFAAWQDGTRLDFRGEFTTHTLMTPNFNPGPLAAGPPPILLGALGPKMTEMAAGVADGLLVMPFNSRRHLVARTLPAVARGLEAAGRRPESLEVVCEVMVAAGRTPDELARAVAGTRALCGFYGSTPAYRPVLEAEGRGELQDELNAMSKRGEWAAMAGSVDDALLAEIAVVGSPAECAAAIAGRFGDIADRICCYFPYGADDGLVGDVVAACHAALA